ncbi:hypothetical protein [Flavilitoribacter nigricans]|uniref:Uncharacterized protein n=1 Tax=Flavilitoribacter nigricans (strain ATCC 23147 / DSM 23189 / NBRC 102662 / NCIMB 1420 / SS-2) TaxID=1122177 RepID=A0A2D0NAT3_FLAN2|nr:hypothetical protein [Flavilitoribacter nigricans]PHN04873.1 hypothetical protein CRP01_20415 [Flavilitoribacter nigricans DSM 23189 = NBRC 102662]
MSTTSHPDIPLWIQNRIIGFFNRARNVDMILDGTIRDDPADGPGKTMGRTLAARILRVRNELPRRRFSDLAEIDRIAGVGTGTLQDLVYSFGVSAAEAFRGSMYESGTIYEGNWALEFFRFPLEDQQEFESIARDEKELRQFVLEKLTDLLQERSVGAKAAEAMLTDIRTAYIDQYSNSTPAAAYALALWFYEFDADNWFSWERIQQQTIAYFEHNASTYPWLMDLYLFKGFRNKGIIPSGICPEDLPVVVNWAEQTITLWVSALYD